jgi:signal transduction histidine kinase
MRRLLPRSVRGRLLVLVALVVGGALAIMTVGFNVLLARSLDGDATRLAHSRASTILATVRISDGAVKISETQDDAAVDSEAWVFNGTRIVEAPHASAATNAAAHVLARSDIRSLDTGDLRLFATPILSDGKRIGTVVAGVALAPYEQTRKTALELSTALAVALFIVVLLVARSLLSQALRPVSTMTSAAAAWSAEESERRFDMGPPHDELTQLAATLDGLLDRLAASLRHERLFSAELSHELRTPLARILARSEMMLSRARTTVDYREALEGIRESALQMTRTVDTLVSEARWQASGSRESCDLREVLETIVRASAEPARQQGRQIELAEPGTRIRVGASADLVERVIHPVVENACRYGDSVVRIRADRRGASHVRVSVSDDGPGIVADERERIFEPGFRGRAGATGGGGAGLGLALARRLATSAGGTIEVPESAHGGLIVIELPTS